MGTGDILLGGNPTMDWHSLQGGVAILLSLLRATETGNKLRPCEPLARVRLYFTSSYMQASIPQTVHYMENGYKHSAQRFPGLFGKQVQVASGYWLSLDTIDQT